MKSDVLITASDGAFDAHLTRPDTSEGKSIVLLHEIFGVTDKIRNYCTLFASRGYTVLAPDLFWRLQRRTELPYTKEGMKEAFELLGRFDEEKALYDISACIAYLRSLPGSNGQVAVLGFCLGGKLSAHMASSGEVSAAISFYGVGIEKFVSSLCSCACPIQMHFAARDRFVDAVARETIETALAGRPNTEIYVYDANHAFFNADLNDAASATSFQRATKFLSLGRNNEHAS